ncbi:MAG: carboxypeptidase-like regulatory domain-containing protein, partial [Muribaculaceae bacterium]|nr:carboxypeptidase-like regulatory domain-containing protein [Muribaculaceae bacterium]
MTRLITIITVLTLAASSLYGRSITGTVLADSDSTAIAGAICQLKDGNRIVNAVATSADGRFSFAVDVKSSLTLEISMTGYCATEIIIDNGNRTIHLGNIYLNEGIALSELTVTEHNIVDSHGRTLVYPSAADVSASATSIGLLQKLPLAGLDVNPINRSMTVDGRVPMILINGVPSSTDDVNALQPKDIARIEYSRITPARYADRNVNGLISITLKKRDDGGEFYGWGRSAVAKAFVDGNIRTSYHHGPSQLSLAYNPSWRSYRNVYDTADQQYIGDDYRVNLQSYDRNPFNYLSTPIRAKYNYMPDQHTLFSATVTMHTLTGHRRLIGHTD